MKYVEDPNDLFFEFQSKNQMKPYLYTYQYYYNLIENLYFEKGEGEISVFVNYQDPQRLFMVTCIDISTLYVEKRGKAFEQITKIAEMNDPSLVKVHRWWNIEDQLLFVEMEAPSIFYHQYLVDNKDFPYRS